MKLYFAGAGHIKPTVLRKYGVCNKLYSYYNETKAIKQWGTKGLMLDSGAFSVFTKGVSIDINELTSFVKLHKPEVAVQLDVIGNEQKTWDNYLYQKKSVNTILPVIHYGATQKHVKRVIESTDYILLGGLVPLARKRQKLISWLDYLYGEYKLYDKKIHLLGITSIPILERYPIYSCDSSSWLSDNRYPSKINTLTYIHQKKKDYKELELRNVKKFLTVERQVTKLWKSRGVTWES